MLIMLERLHDQVEARGLDEKLNLLTDRRFSYML
jgi:hypothetical protein